MNYINLKSDGSQEHRMSKPYAKYSTPIDLAIVLSYGDKDIIIKILYVNKTLYSLIRSTCGSVYRSI